MRLAILYLSIVFASGLTLVTLYNTVVDAASWSADVPASIQVARDYFLHIDPRRFYLMVGPPTVLLSLWTLILFWNDAATLRFYFGAAFVLYAAIIILTIFYFVPLDLTLFSRPMADIGTIRDAVTKWKHMNWLRTLLGSAGVLCACKGLDIYYRVR